MLCFERRRDFGGNALGVIDAPTGEIQHREIDFARGDKQGVAGLPAFGIGDRRLDEWPRFVHLALHVEVCTPGQIAHSGCTRIVAPDGR